MTAKAPKRKWMVKALREHLVPEFTKLGFEHIPVGKDEPREFRSRNQLGYLQRRAKAGIERVEIAMSEAPRSSFSVSFGTNAYEGMTFHGVFRSAEELGVAEAPVLYSICYRPKNLFSEIWWVFYWPWQTPVYEDYVKLAQRVATHVNEVEDLFRNGIVGPHIRGINLPNFDWIKVGRQESDPSESA